jgi:Flp pilus assembly protein TadD
MTSQRVPFRARIPSVDAVAERPLVVLLVIATLATLIYSNTFSASFHFDDKSAITNNSQIKHLSAFRDVSESRYVGILTFALNYHFGGLSVFGYHVINHLIHITNGFLVYTMVSLLLRTPALRETASSLSATGSRLVALIVALVFVAHPLQTQAVTYIVQRFASLATLFYLLAVVCYLRWRLAGGSTRSRYAWYAVALGSTVLAMKTKEISFTLPVMLLVVEGLLFQTGTRRRWIPLVPFVATMLITPLSFPAGMEEPGPGIASESITPSRLSYLLTQFRVIVKYLRLLVFPVHQTLDYDHPIYDSFWDVPVFVSFLFLLVIAGVTVYLLFWRPKYRLVGFGLLWFFITLSVESSIIPIRDVIFEHRLYLPSVGFFLAGIALVAGFRNHLSAVPVVVIAGTIIAVCSVATYSRNAVWLDEVTLWSHSVSESPRKSRTHTNLGNAYLAEGRIEEALAEFATAVQLNPRSLAPHLGLGKVYLERGQIENAIQELETAVKINPNFGEARTTLGYAYTIQGRFDSAIQELQASIRLRPDFADAHNSLGQTYLAQGRLDEALAEIMTAVYLNPDSPEAHGNLGTVYVQQGRADLATREYSTAVRLAPGSAEAHANLGYAYALQRQLDLATSEFQRAAQLKPNDPQIHSNLGNAYTEQGRVDLATQEYLTAIRLDQNFAMAHHNLGSLYLRQQRLDEAAEELVTAIRLKPDYVEAYTVLGIVYSVKGLKDRARSQFETALRHQPDFVPAQRALKALDSQS